MPEELYNVIKTSKEISELTEGTFDITVQPFLDLWESAEKENRVPRQNEIAETKEAVGMEHVLLLPDNNIQMESEPD